MPEAIAAYERLLRLKPDLADSWYNLGFLQKRAGAFEDSLRSYDRALALNVPTPEEVHLNRAVIFSDYLHRPANAEQELRAALAKNAGYVPAWLNLGNLMEDLGNRDEAEAAYRQALRLDPDNALALARLATVFKSTSIDPAIVAGLRRLLASDTTSASEKAHVGFALAAVLDACGSFEEALQAAQAANKASRAAAGATAKYDHAAQQAFVDVSMATFNQAKPSSGGPRAPVFICGMFRSGSTLIEQTLARHSRVVAGGELDIIPALAGSIPGYPGALRNASEADLHRWRSIYLQSLPAMPSRDLRITDKRPDNFLHIGFMKMLFPEAKIIHSRRNPLDNLLSLYFLHLDPGMAYALDLWDAMHWHGQYRRLMAYWKSLFSADIIDVDYDVLVRDPRPQLESLVRFLELDWEDGLLDFQRTNTPVKTASVWQVREPLHTRSSGRWRNYERQLGPLKALIDSVQDA